MHRVNIECFCARKSKELRKIELLAPAKDYGSAVAAVECGADAIYIGAAKFGARHSATNSVEHIARVVRFAHQFGVRVYATLNTLLWNSELQAAREQAEELIAVGIDAIIVQDAAYLKMGLQVEIHASTQFHNVDSEGVQFLADVGIKRVILERGLSLEQISTICRDTSVEIECFVHGAICVGYSGRCFLSRTTSERSGNRGECSQPCRLPYDLTNGEGRVYAKGKHLLSVRDFDLSQHIGSLLDAGVSSFKIEGRLKDINYIRNTVAHYRRVIDKAVSEREGYCRSSLGRSVIDFSPSPAKSFTRLGSEYHLLGKVRGVATLDTPKAMGEALGRVVSVESEYFTLDGSHTLSAGDGICFLRRGELIGTNINRVEGLKIYPNRMDGVERRAVIYRNFDHKFNLTLTNSRTQRTLEVDAHITLDSKSATLRYTEEGGCEAQLRWDIALDRAKNRGANRAAIQEQVARLGDTIFRLRCVELQGEEWFMPASLMAKMRREVLEVLAEKCQNRELEHQIFSENLSARHPKRELTPQDNVTNHLAHTFYIEHGVERIEKGQELASTMRGHTVLRSGHCIRRELGECLMRSPRITGELYLERNNGRYRLQFDCAKCEMTIIDYTKN